MATTTNFGWETPDDTDLVKDGAAAIRTALGGVDTSFVDLKGGTTGQILSKASNTDLDYSWITNDVGDITAVTAGTGITGGGTSGAVTVSFDQANYGGGQYAAGKNKIINGDFKINQRSFTSSTTGTYGFDRWGTLQSDGTVTYSAQTFTAGTAPVAGYEAANYARLVTTGQTLTSAVARWYQAIEDVRTFAGQTVTVSFWAKAATGTPKMAFELNQSFGTGGSPSATVNNYVGQVTLSTSWARYSLTYTVPSISGKTVGTTTPGALFLQMWVSAGSDANARTGSLGIQSNTFDLWGVQVEAGSTATPFQTATGTIQGELAACQRYYYRNTMNQNDFTLSNGVTTTICQFPVNLKQTMRISPNAIESSGIGIYRILTGASVTGGTLTLHQAMQDQVVLRYTVGSATFVAGETQSVYGTASGSYIALSAEL